MTKHLVLCGDCIELLPKHGPYNFAFLDPPFNLGQKYVGYNDNLDDWDFTRNLFNWVQTSYENLTSTGILCLHGPDSLCEMYLDVAKQRGYKRIAWINWHYRFGQCGRSNWIDARCHCLIYAKDPKNYTWNPEDVLVESDRVAYRDKRIHETENGGMRLPMTMWGEEIDKDSEAWAVPTGIETMRQIPGHPDYFATFEGGIISMKGGTPKYLSQQLDPSKRYLRVWIENEGSKHLFVHRLVCSAFSGKPEKGMHCRHLDGLSTNNRADNLKWGTPKENCADRAAHGKTARPYGEKNGEAKITINQLEEIRELLDQGELFQREIGEMYGLSQSQVSRIKLGLRWKTNTWGIPSDGPYWCRVQGTSKERREGHPNQLPIRYLQRLIFAYTNKGDLVCDPFCGSGTTGLVCKHEDRNFIGIDISKDSVRSATRRIKHGFYRTT